MADRQLDSNDMVSIRVRSMDTLSDVKNCSLAMIAIICNAIASDDATTIYILEDLNPSKTKRERFIVTIRDR